MSKNLTILGHRGAVLDTEKPYQNSLTAFELALKHADGFETDATASADGVVFLAHDARFKGNGVEYCLSEHLDAASVKKLGSKRLDELSVAQARALRLKDGSPLPELSEIIKLFKNRPDKILNIELKSCDVHKPVLVLLDKAVKDGIITPAQILLSSFNHAALAEVRRAAPQYRIGALFCRHDQAARAMFPWLKRPESRYLPATDEHIHALAFKPDVIIMPHTEATPERLAFIAKHHPQATAAVWVYTEMKDDEPKAVARLKEVAAAYPTLATLMVDRPDKVRR